MYRYATSWVVPGCPVEVSRECYPLPDALRLARAQSRRGYYRRASVRMDSGKGRVRIVAVYRDGARIA